MTKNQLSVLRGHLTRTTGKRLGNLRYLYVDVFSTRPRFLSRVYFYILIVLATTFTAVTVYFFSSASSAAIPDYIALLSIIGCILSIGGIIYHYSVTTSEPRILLSFLNESSPEALRNALTAHTDIQSLNDSSSPRNKSYTDEPSNSTTYSAPPYGIVSPHTQRISRKTRTLDVLYEVVAALNDAHTRDEMLSTFLDVLSELLDANGAQILLKEGNNTLSEAANIGEPNKTTRAAARQEYLDEVIQNVSNTGRFSVQKIVLTNGNISEPDQQDKVSFEYIVAPVRYRNAILGVYILILPDEASGAFGDDFPDLITSLGRHLGLALEKARLDDHARRLAVIEERDILRNELHDTLAQYLVSMRLQAKMLGELLYRKEFRAAESEAWQLRLAIEEANASLRELLASFRFKMDERGLIPALADLVQRFEQDTRITAFFQHRIRDLQLTPTQEVEVYRIVQEALSNIKRHSQALTARVLLVEDEAGYKVIIEDDGIGMQEDDRDVEKKGEGKHIGLAIMKDRCRRLGGKLKIESDTGEGTRVILLVPIKKYNNETSVSGMQRQ